MKIRLFSLVLAVMLLCCTAAQAAEMHFSGLFSFSYDETLYECDTTSWLDQNTAGKRWLMMLYATDYLIDASLTRTEGWEQVTLKSADDPAFAWYLDNMTADGFEHLGTQQADGAAFALFRTSDADGEYLLAETVANGWSISFYAYYDDTDRPADDALLSALQAVVQTCRP